MLVSGSQGLGDDGPLDEGGDDRSSAGEELANNIGFPLVEDVVLCGLFRAESTARPTSSAGLLARRSGVSGRSMISAVQDISRDDERCFEMGDPPTEGDEHSGTDCTQAGELAGRDDDRKPFSISLSSESSAPAL